jgi:hypothetical protein
MSERKRIEALESDVDHMLGRIGELVKDVDFLAKRSMKAVRNEYRR